MFRRRRPPTEPVPADAAFLEAETWSRFRAILDRHVAARGGQRSGLEIRFADGAVLYLGNLARSVHNLGDDERDEASIEQVVLRYLDLLRTPVSPESILRDDPATARTMLRTRPYAASAFSDVPHPVVSRPLAGELVDAVVLDFPESVAILTQPTVAAAGLDPDELLDLGLDNVRQEPPPELVDHLRSGDGVDMWILGGESFYSATWMRWLDLLRLPTGVPPGGALVAAPLRQQLLVVPLVDAVHALVGPGAVLQLAALGISDGIGPLSAQLFWYRNGTLTHLPGGVAEQQVVFQPTAEYTDLCTSLGGPS